MLLKDKILNKLQPHAERIIEGVNDEFDYLPGVLAHLLQEQDKHSENNIKQIAELSNQLNHSLMQLKADNQNMMARIQQENQGGLQAIAKHLSQSVVAINNSMAQLKADNQNMMARIQQENQGSLQAIAKHLSQSVDAINNSMMQLKLSIETETKKMRLLLNISLILSSFAVAIVIYLATK